MAVNWRTTV
uniref:Uncharacterized protein n=1 Tax=Anguilla anguilla TaxID=7936 RepID=A0A0E9SQ69_ANGAN